MLRLNHVDFYPHLFSGTTCGEDILNQASGEIVYHNYYRENYVDCAWTIVGGIGKIIDVKIARVHISEDVHCIYNYLKVNRRILK